METWSIEPPKSESIEIKSIRPILEPSRRDSLMSPDQLRMAYMIVIVKKEFFPANPIEDGILNSFSLKEYEKLFFL